MNSYNEHRNIHLRKQVLQSLLKMMQTQDINDISISSLTENAGIGRASFYRNYDSKEDVLRQEAISKLQRWGRISERDPRFSPIYIFESLFTHIRENGEFYAALQKAGLMDIILDTLVEKVGLDPSMPNEEAYAKASLAYMIFGWINEWMKRGMQEKGDELKDMLMRNSSNG